MGSLGRQGRAGIQGGDGVRVTNLTHHFPTPGDPPQRIPAAEQASAMSSGACVDVVCGSFAGEDDTAVVEGLPVRCLSLPWPRFVPAPVALVAASIAFASRAAALLRSLPAPPDLIHAHGSFPDGVVGASVAARLGVPCVVTLHGEEADLRLRLPVVGRAIARMLARASAIVCVSEHLREELAARHPMLRELLVTVPDGYDPRDVRFDPHVLPAAHFLFLGALQPGKQPDLLLRAYSRIAPRTRLDLAIAGEGPMGPRLRTLARELGIEGRVRFLGRLTRAEVGEALRRAKALVVPGTHEGMPIAAIEALATGTPVIAPALGGLPELVNDEVTGLLVEPGSVESLALALMRASGRDWDEFEVVRVANVLTRDESAERIREIYQQVISGERPGPRKRLAYLSLAAAIEGETSRAHDRGLVSGLRSRGWRVDVYAPRYRSTSPSVLGRLAEFARVQRQLCEELDGSDVLYCRTHLASLPSALAARRRGIPVVHEVRGAWDDLLLSRRHKRHEARPWTRGLERLLTGLVLAQWRHAAALVTLTNPLARWIGEQVPSIPVKVVPNAADTTVFQPRGERASALPRRYVVFMGELARRHGLDTLLEATARPEWPAGVRAVIAGDGLGRGAVAQAVAEGRPVTYAGRVPYRTAPSILRGALAAVSARSADGGSFDAGFSPVGVYEALACDVPVIVSDHPGQADLVRETGCGLVVPAEDAVALARAVAKLADDEAAAERLGRLGGKIVRHWHSWDVRAGQTDALLHQVRTRSRIAGATDAAKTAKAALRQTAR